MKATIKDIAEYTNVSTATVSLVINNKGNISISTRERVIEALKKFDYKKIPATSVSSVLGHDTKTIKFLRITKHGHVINRDHDVFIADYLEGMTQGAQDHGFKLEAYSFKHTDIDDIIRNTFNDDSTAGLIVLATELNEQDMQHFSEASFPVVFIDNYNEFLPFDFVDMDNSSSIHMAYDYVRSCGFTQIGFISSYTDTNNFKMRERAYRIITDQETHIIQVESTFDGAYQDISNFLSNAENEVMPVYLCANDIMALGAMKAFKEHGYSLPDDVSLIGFDNLPQTQHVDPPLTTIAVSKRRIARIAVQQLKNHIEDPSAPTVRTLVGGRLIIRDSLKKQHQTPNIFSQA